MVTNLPNLLTLSRIVAIVPIVVGFYLPEPTANWVTFGLFAYASITDYFDGLMARRRQQFSEFGRFLDPIADKLLVTAVLFMMVATGLISGLLVFAAVIILLREILVSGLREFLAGADIGMPVTALAKWKTGFQLVGIALLLLNDAVSPVPAVAIGSAILWVAAALTLYTGYGYLRVGIEQLSAKRSAAAK